MAGKWTRRLAGVAGANLVAFLVGSGVAAAYSYVSGYKWSGTSATFYYSTGFSSAFVTAMRAADTAWRNAGSKFTFEYGGTTTRNASRVFSGSTDGYNDVGYGRLSSGTIAATAGGNSSKPITEVDIGLNTTYYAFTTLGTTGSYDVQNILTHEFGHALDLWDLSSTSSPSYCGYSYESTMCGSAAANETRKRSLETDDINGIRYVYGTK